MAERVALGLVLTMLIVGGVVSAVSAGENSPVTRPLVLAPSAENPRNSEGDFVRLADGRVLLVYTHFTGGGSDHATAHLAGRYSSDGGRTWTGDDVVIVPNEGDCNVMSVSLLRLADGRIALFYLRKNSLSDCRPLLRYSTDEAKTWSDPIECIAKVGYYVMNNDRAVQLSSGRLVLPVCLHDTPSQKKPDWAGTLMCYLSDDAGRTWRRSRTAQKTFDADGGRVVTQEPGVVELEDGRLMMFSRTDSGSQYVCYSSDGGEKWTKPEPSAIISPRSPASIERIPSTGDLLLVWNDHRCVDQALRGKRTPLCVAISCDEAKTWEPAQTLEDDPHGWYCYTAIEFVGGHVLLAHCSGNRRKGNGLARSQVTRFPIQWLYSGSRRPTETLKP
jgi:hypothetical protein